MVEFNQNRMGSRAAEGENEPAAVQEGPGAFTEKFAALGLPPAAVDAGDERIELEPEHVEQFLGAQGVLELVLEPTGSLRLELDGRPFDDARGELSNGELTVLMELTRDPDKIGSGRPGARDRREVLKLIREEVLPILVAEALQLTGIVTARAADGFDVCCRREESGEIENVQIKLVPPGSPLLRRDQSKGRKNFYKLVSLLERPAAAPTAALECVLLVQYGAECEVMQELVQDLARAGVSAESIRVLSERELALRGIELPRNLRISDSPSVLFRIDRQQQARALLADILLYSIDAAPAGEPLPESGVLPRLAELGVVDLARELAADRASWNSAAVAAGVDGSSAGDPDICSGDGEVV